MLVFTFFLHLIRKICNDYVKRWLDGNEIDELSLFEADVMLSPSGLTVKGLRKIQRFWFRITLLLPASIGKGSSSVLDKLITNIKLMTTNEARVTLNDNFDATDFKSFDGVHTTICV